MLKMTPIPRESNSPLPSQPMTFFVAELHAFSKLPPNTPIQKDENGRFIPIVNRGMWVDQENSLAWQKNAFATAENIDTFVKELSEKISKKVALAKKSEVVDVRKRTFRSLLFVNQQINRAASDKESIEGLYGLTKTYANYATSSSKIINAIEQMKSAAFEALKVLRDVILEYGSFKDKDLSDIVTDKYGFDEVPFCPEQEYSDKEWEKAIAMSAALRKEHVDPLRYYVTFCGGLGYNQVRNIFDSYLSSLNKERSSNWNWWDKIGDFEGRSLYLGALPLSIEVASYEQRNDLDALKKEGINAVLSVVEVSENHSDGFFSSSIKPEDYARQDIKQLQLPTPDRETIPIGLILRGVEFIHWNLINSRNIYVHCKAGRGRSLLVVVCYLIKYHQMTVEAAYSLVQEKRPQAGFSQERREWETLRAFEKLYPPKE